MIKKYLKFSFLFFISFALEVRVKASASADHHSPPKQSSSEEVKKCFFKTSCAGAAEEVSFFLQAKEAYTLSGDMIFKNSSEERSLILVEGALYSLGLTKYFEVQTLHAKVMKKSGDFLVRKNKDRFEVFNFSGELVLQLRDGVVLSIPEGFFVWVGGISSVGENEVSPVTPIETAQLEDILPMPSASRDQKLVRGRVARYGELWGNNVVKASQIYKQSVEREIASEKEAEKRKIETEKALEHQRALKRQNFFQKSFER